MGSQIRLWVLNFLPSIFPKCGISNVGLYVLEENFSSGYNLGGAIAGFPRVTTPLLNIFAIVTGGASPLRTFGLGIVPVTPSRQVGFMARRVFTSVTLTKSSSPSELRLA